MKKKKDKWLLLMKSLGKKVKQWHYCHTTLLSSCPL